MATNTFTNQAKLTVNINNIEKTFLSNELIANLAALTIVKTQSVNVVTSGDEIKYSFLITNIGLGTLTSVKFSDTIPAGLSYVSGTFKVNGVITLPIVASQDISYVFANIVGLAIVNIEFTCLVL